MQRNRHLCWLVWNVRMSVSCFVKDLCGKKLWFTDGQPGNVAQTFSELILLHISQHGPVILSLDSSLVVPLVWSPTFALPSTPTHHPFVRTYDTALLIQLLRFSTCAGYPWQVMLVKFVCLENHFCIIILLLTNVCKNVCYPCNKTEIFSLENIVWWFYPVNVTTLISLK